MGRKIDMKKIEDVTKCQVTFSKRRSSLMKKANEIAVCCDVDVAFVAFSPSGRVSKFCNKKRIEALLHRYVNLPAECRVNHLDNVQRKLEKLKHLDHIQSETSKLQYLDKQTENLELQIKKSGLELQILEANLRDFELDPEQEPSLHLLSWCERNINQSLERVQARKIALLGHLQTSHAQPSSQNQDGVQVFSNFNMKESNLPAQISTAGQIPTEVVDPWMISPFSAKIREIVVEELPDQANINPGATNLPISSHTYDISHSRIIHEPGFIIPSFQIPQQQPLVVDHALLDFTQQNTVTAWNTFSSATFSNAIYNSTHSVSTMPTPRFTPTITTSYASDVKMPQHDAIQSRSQYEICNFSQFTYSGGEGEEITQVNKACTSHDQSEAQGTSGDSWTSKIQKSNLWEWEDLLLDENLNFGGFSK